MENNEKVIEMKPERQEEKPKFEVNLKNTAKVAALGAIKPFSWGGVYVVGLSARLLLGKKAGLKAMGAYVAINSAYNVARFVTGEWDKED